MQIWRGKLISRKISDRKIVTFLHCVYHWENSMSCHLKKVAEKNFFELFFDKTFFFQFSGKTRIFLPFWWFHEKSDFNAGRKPCITFRGHQKIQTLTKIVLQSRFYVKSILSDFKRSRTVILTILEALNFYFWKNVNEISKISKNSKFRAVSMVKIAVFDLLKSAKIDFT